mmetsp:Transcript_87238/g.170684  ORF Transcript_87238/g.170684 Transcript_87238/m.170684 type:complete len:264 (+) Transcript_87238:65-856(+)
MALETSIDAWCHICNAAITANLNSSSGEYVCSVCQSDCVERVGQGIDEFSAPTIDQSSNSNELIQQIMNQVLGLNNREGNNQTSQMQLGNQPVNIIVRHLGPVNAPSIPPAPSASYSSANSVLGLLTTLNALRPAGAHSNDGGMIFGDLTGGDEQGSAQWENFLHYILMNENSHAGAPPAPKSLLDGLKRVEITAETDVTPLGECCITQDPFEAGDVMVPLPCGHRYKQEPIIHWLEMHNTCPVCRVEVEAEDSVPSVPAASS